MEPQRIAMWSGPRNLSTALMRSFSSRSDTAVIDEPLYAAYLHETGLPHPGRAEILQAYPTDWRDAVARLFAPAAAGVRVVYQKHMTHHLLPDMDRDWVGSLRNAFLIRDPREVLASYAQVIEAPTLEDLGLPQQVELFERVEQVLGQAAPVVDAKDLLLDPEAVLQRLCARLEISYEARMLRWPQGSHPEDGCWAPHWYAGVQASSGFGPYRPKEEPLPARLEPLAERCRPYYERLHPHRIRAD